MLIMIVNTTTRYQMNININKFADITTTNFFRLFGELN